VLLRWELSRRAKVSFQTTEAAEDVEVDVVTFWGRRWRHCCLIANAMVALDNAPSNVNCVGRHVITFCYL